MTLPKLFNSCFLSPYCWWLLALQQPYKTKMPMLSSRMGIGKIKYKLNGFII